MAGLLTHSGFVVPMQTMKTVFGPRLRELLNKLTVSHPQKIGPPKKACMYRIATYNGVQCIHLPRTLIRVLARVSIRVEVMFTPPVTIAAEMSAELYDNQKAIVDHICGNIFTPARVADGTAAALLNLRAGMGKTFVAAGVIARLKMRTLYVVPKRPLMMQAVKDLRACLAGPIIGQHGKADAGHGVTCIVINSALELGPTELAGYSMVILDEVHSYCSEQRRRIFGHAAHVVLGMSATTEDRNDGFDVIAHKELAFDGIVRAEKIPGFTYEDVVFDCRARVIAYTGPAESTQNLVHESTGHIFTHYMHNQFINDEYRLRLAVGELARLYDWEDGGRRHHIYVFAEEIDILKRARDAFTAALTARARTDIAADIVAPEIGAELFTGGLKDEAVAGIVRDGRVLFSTYGYAGTGISILKMSAILLLTPRKSGMKQILARVLRRGSDLQIPRVVVDIVDSETALKHQARVRRAAYEYYGFKMEKVRAVYTDV